MPDCRAEQQGPPSAQQPLSEVDRSQARRRHRRIKHEPARPRDEQRDHVGEVPGDPVNAELREADLLGEVQAVEVHGEEIDDRGQEHPPAEPQQLPGALADR